MTRTIGSLQIFSTEPRPFTDQQIALLETFADQAAIAIENARMFQELQESNRQVTEALEQQTATADILRGIALSPTDADPVIDTIARTAGRLSNSTDVWLNITDGEQVRVVAGYGTFAHPVHVGSVFVPHTESVNSQVLRGHRTIHIPDSSDPAFRAAYPGARYPDGIAFLTIPLVREDEAIGFLFVARDRAEPYGPREIALLETFADQAVIAIENARLFQELEQRNREVNEALEQQTALGDVLRVIASSPTDLQQVLDTIVVTASRLCDADTAAVQQRIGEYMVPQAVHGRSAESASIMEGSLAKVRAGTFLGTLCTRDSASGTALLDRRTVHVPDTSAAQRDVSGRVCVVLSARDRHAGIDAASARR